MYSDSIRWEKKQSSIPMTLSINLLEKWDAPVKAQAKAAGISEAGFVEKMLEQALDANLRPLEEQTPVPKQSSPLSARIRKIWSDMSEEERAEYPAGGAFQIDHHVYGLPKE
jgi:hypothetical protein